ncbi:MAG: porin, partial [Nitrospinota bacterium]
DLLKKKGVITEQEYKELKGAEQREKARLAEQIKKSQPPFDIKYKDGFRITSKDKRHGLRVGVQVFSQLSVFAGDDDDAHDNFLLRRGRVTFRGKVFGDFTYRLELDGASSPVLDQDAYMGWEKYKAFRIRAGQHKTRFGGEQTWSRYSLFFLERSMISDNLTEGASRGVFVYGDLHPTLGYQASVSNGTGRSSDTNDEKDFAVRLIGKPFKGTAWEKMLPIEVAGNLAIGDQPFSSTGGRTRLFLRDNRLTVFSVSTEGLRTRFGGDIWYNKDYKNKGGLPLSATAEFIYERQERDGPVLGMGNDDLVRYGYHVQAGYLLMGSRSKNGLELVAKVESIDMDDSENDGGPDELLGQTVYTYGFGVNYWPIKEVRLSVNGFLFDIDRPLTTAADDDPFNNGDSAWAIVSGFYFKY